MYKFARNLMIIYYYINLIVHLIKFTFQPYLINQSMIFFAFCTFAGLNITFIRSLFFSGNNGITGKLYQKVLYKKVL